MVGEKIILRALEPEDLNFLYLVENNVNNWEVSETKIPFSKYLLHEYLKTIGDDITKSGQLRLVIQDKTTKKQMGLIDLFDFDAINRKCGVGIIINSENRNKGIATETLTLIEKYCKETLNLHQLYCDIQSSNSTSISLFEKNGFVKTGIKKDWSLKAETYSDILFYQKII
jgi:diamine N-acetyltransferase